jgi:hypothetical protein
MVLIYCYVSPEGTILLLIGVANGVNTFHFLVTMKEMMNNDVIVLQQ